MKIIPVVFVLLSIFSISASALEIEDDSEKDAGLATIWAIGQITDGGYLKTGLYSGLMYNSLPVFGEIEGGWRIANHYTFGMNLRPGISEIKDIDSKAVMVAFTFGYRDNLPGGRPYLFDVKLGTIDLTSLHESMLFLEPNFNLITKTWNKRFSWALGISYRHMQGSGNNRTLGRKLSGPGLTFTLGMGKY